jgi:hypothetical protein
VSTTFPMLKYLDGDGSLTADSVRAVIEDASPEMAEALSETFIAIMATEPDLR